MQCVCAGCERGESDINLYSESKKDIKHASVNPPLLATQHTCCHAGMLTKALTEPQAASRKPHRRKASVISEAERGQQPHEHESADDGQPLAASSLCVAARIPLALAVLVFSFARRTLCLLVLLICTCPSKCHIELSSRTQQARLQALKIHAVAGA